MKRRPDQEGLPDPSHLVDTDNGNYGSKTMGVTEEMEDAMFDGAGDFVAPEPVVQQPAPAPKPQPAPVIKPDNQLPENYEVESDEEEGQKEGVLNPDPESSEQTPATESEQGQQPTDAEVSPPSDSEVEIEQKEYDYLKTLDADQLIARMVSHRKGKSTLQSRVDKIKNVVGDSFWKAVEDGQDLRGASRLLSDLSHPEFQSHIKDFYDSHELRGDTYIRTKQASTPPLDVLSKYTELITKQAELNPVQYMDKDAEFDANEALSRPGSPSGRAYAKYESEKMKLQREIDTIMQQSAEVGAPKPDQVREAAAVLQRQWQDLVSHNKELQDQTKLSDFQRFVDDYRNKPLEAFWLAFRQASNGKANTIRLVMRELANVSANKSAPVSTSQKVQSGVSSKHKIKVPANIRREDVAGVIKDHEYFGDIL